MRRSAALIVVAVMVVLAGAVVAAVVAVTGTGTTAGTAAGGGTRPLLPLETLPGEGSPTEAAAKYLAAWERGDVEGMRALVAEPPAGFAELHERLVSGLRASGERYRLGAVRGRPDGGAEARFTASMTVPGIGAWRYEGSMRLVRTGGRWLVEWEPRTVHPDLVKGARLVLRKAWPERAPILAADGSRLDERVDALAAGQLVGTLDEVTADDLAELGGAYKAGDRVGRRGLQRAYESSLAGAPGDAIQVVGAGGEVRKTLARKGGRQGRELRTTIDPRAQSAAARAIDRARERTMLVAVRPSTGEVLAVASNRVADDRALLGRYPPGSTFKVVSAAALLAGGLDPAARVECPARVTIQGRTFRNAEGESLGATTFRDAFAHSCNTTFARLAVDRLSGTRLRRVAEQFGFGAPLTPGLPAERGQVPLPVDDVELAATAFGQARVVASPLLMATVAGAVADGTWRPPRLVTNAETGVDGVEPAAPRRLDPAVAGTLRQLMRAAVSEGTAGGAGLPSGTAGKTGTAEYGGGPDPPAHSWFIGYRGDLAFAVISEGAGFGAEVAAPIAASFLRRL